MDVHAQLGPQNIKCTKLIEPSSSDYSCSDWTVVLKISTANRTRSLCLAVSVTLLHRLSSESLFSRVTDLLQLQLCNVHRCSPKRLHSKKMKAICFIPQFGTFCHASCQRCVTGHTEHQELMHVNDYKELARLLDNTHTHTYHHSEIKAGVQTMLLPAGSPVKASFVKDENNCKCTQH